MATLGATFAAYAAFLLGLSEVAFDGSLRCAQAFRDRCRAQVRLGEKQPENRLGNYDSFSDSAHCGFGTRFMKRQRLGNNLTLVGNEYPRVDRGLPRRLERSVVVLLVLPNQRRYRHPTEYGYLRHP